MFKAEIVIDDDIKLIKPDIERDARLGYEWLQGEVGATTMQLMGNSDFSGTTLQQEEQRVAKFINEKDSINWSIALDDHVIGSVWLDYKEINVEQKAWWLSFMIGNASMRGRGVGFRTCSAVINWSFNEGGMEKIWARHLQENQTSRKLLVKLGFLENGPLYESEGNMWQNYELTKDVWTAHSS